MRHRCAYCGKFFDHSELSCRDEITCQRCTRDNKDKPQHCVECGKQLTNKEAAHEDAFCNECAAVWASKLAGLLAWMDKEDITKTPPTVH